MDQDDLSWTSLELGLFLVSSVLFSSLWSYSVLLVPIQSYFVHLVHFVPFVFTSVHLDRFNSFWSTSVRFCTLEYREKDMFKLRVPILNPNIYKGGRDTELEAKAQLYNDNIT